MAPHRLNIKPPHLVTLMILSAFAAMGAIVMMPALPEITNHFHITKSTAQLVVTYFLFGYTIGQLLYGPIANRYGRKHAIYIGIIIATLGSIFSIISSPLDSFRLLILGRFFEAVGSSAGLSISIAMINDFYFEADVRRIMGLLMLAFAIVPGVAIAIGGILVQYLHWQSCFYFLLLYGLILIYPIQKLSETNLSPDLNAMKYQHVFRNYWNHFKIKKLMGFAIIIGFSTGGIYVFGAAGPFIGIHLLHVEPAIYGGLALLPYIGTLIGSLVVTRLSQVNSYVVFKIGFLFELCACITMFLLFYCHYVSLNTLLIPMGLFCLGHPMITATFSSLSLQQTNDKSNGSSVVNATSIFVSVLMTFLLTTFHSQNPLVLPLVLLTGIILMAICFVWTTKSQ